MGDTSREGGKLATKSAKKTSDTAAWIERRAYENLSKTAII
jgi:hypothetical protein